MSLGPAATPILSSPESICILRLLETVDMRLVRRIMGNTLGQIYGRLPLFGASNFDCNVPWDLVGDVENKLSKFRSIYGMI